MEQFLELFHPNPGNSYLLVTSKIDSIADALFQKTQDVGGEFKIALYGDGNYEKAKLQIVDNLTKPFKAQPREFDRVIFYDIFTKHASQNMLLKLAYTALSNAAEIIIVEPKGKLERLQTYELLEANEFRAPNLIEDIVDGHDLFVAKKMHMWGNGL